MSNFGCTDFRYTGGFPVDRQGADDPFSTMDWALSRKGEPILKAARGFATLEEALEGLHLVIGSSGRDREFDGGYARPHVAPGVALNTVREWHAKTGDEFRWGFVLGPEDDGLNQQESSLCQKLVRLPTVDEAPSLNIAMAAGCFLYQWHLTNLGWMRDEAAPETGPFPFMDAGTDRKVFTEAGRDTWADERAKDRFLTYFMETIARTKFLKYPDVEAVKARVRRWLQAAPIPLGELLFGFEMIYHVRAWGSGGTFEARDFLGRLRPHRST